MTSGNARGSRMNCTMMLGGEINSLWMLPGKFMTFDAKKYENNVNRKSIHIALVVN